MKRRTLLAGAAAMAVAPNGMTMAAADALYVPPEEAPHAGTFMMWPASRKVHPDRYFLEMLQDTIADIANTIAAFEPVTMLASADQHGRARKKLSKAVALWDIPTEDLWARDAGPLFAFRGDDLVVSHLKFNGWGNKQIHRNDGQVATRVAERLGLEVVDSGVTGEAGGVEHDGHGLMLAHESSWLNENRNPGLARSEIERRLLKAYGARKMIWATGVYGEDITDYHVDSLARLTGPQRALVNLPAEPESKDPFHTAAFETLDALVRDGLEVEMIPEPTRRRVDSPEFVASYANFYVCNGAVIAAQYGDQETDRLAIEALQYHYPDREIVTLNVDALGEVGGGIHCATQQMPA